LDAQESGRLSPAIVLFGAPGSGKGTQARLLREKCLNGPHISTGDMLRQHIELQDSIGRDIEGRMRAGRLAPDELVNQLVEERIRQPDCRNGFILDGYPRTLHQAAVLLGLVAELGVDPCVVHLIVDYDKLVARLSGRRQCPVCGTLYSLSTNPPKAPGVCDLDGAALVTREDDRESVIRERLEQYELQTRPLLEYFQRVGVVLFEIQGAGATPDAITKCICGKLAVSGRTVR
jgi:adenylate kinase